MEFIHTFANYGNISTLREWITGEFHQLDKCWIRYAETTRDGTQLLYLSVYTKLYLSGRQFDDSQADRQLDNELVALLTSKGVTEVSACDPCYIKHNTIPTQPLI